MEIARNWILAKVQETERASSVLLKDELFQAFHAENPDISHEAFLSYFGRFMGSVPFQSVTSHKKKGKILGYCRFSLKIMKPMSWWFRKKEASSKHAKRVFVDEVSIESKKKG